MLCCAVLCCAVRIIPYFQHFFKLFLFRVIFQYIFSVFQRINKYYYIINSVKNQAVFNLLWNNVMCLTKKAGAEYPPRCWFHAVLNGSVAIAALFVFIAGLFLTSAAFLFGVLLFTVGDKNAEGGSVKLNAKLALIGLIAAGRLDFR